MKIGSRKDMEKIVRDERVTTDGELLPETPNLPRTRATKQSRLRAYSMNGVSVNSASDAPTPRDPTDVPSGDANPQPTTDNAPQPVQTVIVEHFFHNIQFIVQTIRPDPSVLALLTEMRQVMREQQNTINMLSVRNDELNETVKELQAKIEEQTHSIKELTDKDDNIEKVFFKKDLLIQ